MTENRKADHFKLKEVRIRLIPGQELYSDRSLSTPDAAIEIMQKELSQMDREVLCVVNLNSKLQPINFNIVSVGDISNSIAAIPNILKSGLLSNASSFLLLHSHPSGDPTPSQEDIVATKRVIEAGKLMGLPCMDHIIVAAGSGVAISMRDTYLADFSDAPASMTAEEILRIPKIAKDRNNTKHRQEER